MTETDREICRKDKHRTNTRTDRPEGQQTVKQTDRTADIQTDKLVKQSDRHTGEQTDRQSGR